MKKKIMFPVLMLVLSLGLTLPMASPAMAASYGIDLSVSATPNPVVVGGTVDVEVTLVNVGTTYGIKWVTVTLEENSIDISSSLGSPTGDTNNPGILDVGETWTWTVSRTVSAPTTYHAEVHGNVDAECEQAVCDEASACVDVCYCGCTLTPGYWKTHSEYGPAPYDDTWALLSLGADTPFFSSGYSYYEILWTSPRRGDAYLILAHAYIAAELNFLNGADPSAAQAAFDAATPLLSGHVPGETALMGGRNADSVLRANFLALATTLDNYNNGLIGPGHCSD